MDKFKRAAEKELNKNIHPDVLAHEALENARFANEERERFFDNVYGDIMLDYFLEFLRSEPHENKKREFIYNSVLALGDIKTRMASYEMLAKNIRHLEDNNG